MLCQPVVAWMGEDVLVQFYCMVASCFGLLPDKTVICLGNMICCSSFISVLFTT